MAKKSDTLFVCKSCGNETTKWSGQCPYCGEWNSLKEVRGGKKSGSDRGGRSGRERVKPVRIREVESGVVERFSTGIEETDRVFGLSVIGSQQSAGIVPGSVTLLSGEPGMGKSTLLSQLSLRLAGPQDHKTTRSQNSGVLYVCGEESPEQVKMRMERLSAVGNQKSVISKQKLVKGSKRVGVRKAMINGQRQEPEDRKPMTDNLFLLPEIQVETVVEEILSGKDKYKLVIIDSIQSMVSDNVPGFAGSVSQVRECGWQLTQAMKEGGVAGIIVGHVTKEGGIAGPKTLEHMVDTVLRLEGERAHDLRVLRAVKNRFGATDEVGVFRMTDQGLEEVPNIGDVFLEGRTGGPGSVVTAVLEGTRVMLLEVQGLVVKSNLAMPRRVANGVRLSRLQMILAVLQKHLGLRLGEADVYVNVTGGVRIEEPGADLAMALAVISSYKDVAIGSRTVVFGEVGLLGEIRQVSGMEKRWREAKKLGYKRAIGMEERQLREVVKLMRK